MPGCSSVDDIDNEKPDLEMLSPKKPGEDGEDDSKLPSFVEGKSEEVYEVQSVLEHILSPDGFYLKVRWAGYGEDEDSWEPEVDLLECAGEIVTEYIQSLSEKERKAISKFKKDFNSKDKKKGKKSKQGAKSQDSAKRSQQIDSDSDDDANSKSAKRSKREESEEYSDSSSKKSKSRKSNNKNSRESTGPPKKKARETRTVVQTKAALKSYDTPIQPSSAKKAAILHRQTWLQDDSGSSDDEKQDCGISFDEEIKAKVLVKKSGDKEKDSNKEAKTSKERTPIQDRESVHKTSKTTKKNSAEAAGVIESVVTTTNNHSVADSKCDWIIEGLVQHYEGNTEKKLVLVTDKSSNERRVVSPYEAHDLAGWKFCEWLLERCEF